MAATELGAANAATMPDSGPAPSPEPEAAKRATGLPLASTEEVVVQVSAAGAEAEEATAALTRLRSTLRLLHAQCRCPRPLQPPFHAFLPRRLTRTGCGGERRVALVRASC
eukprot:SAG25_NODE_786_length_5332_cov_175.941525_6_plen_111_part_00